jgi:hypothetical protein
MAVISLGLSVLVVLLSAFELDASYYRGEARSASVWAVVFGMSSLVAAWSFWRLV